MTHVLLVAWPFACEQVESFSQPHPDLSISADLAPIDLLTSHRDPKFDPVVDVLRAELDANLGLGVSIAVLEGGAFTWTQGFGSADPFDPRGRTAVDPATVFQLGPITRSMTAAAAMQQVADGRIGVDQPMSELLPDFRLAADPAWSDRATLDHLLSSQAGLYDYLDWVGAEDDRDLADWHYGFYADEMWDMNPPGAFWNLSNTTATFTGLVVEEHDWLGRYFPEILRHDLFEPLGMWSSRARKSDVEEAGHYALSTGLGAPDVFSYADISMDLVSDAAYARPGEFAWGTATDVCLWGRFLARGNPAVLADDARAELVRPRVSTRLVDDHQAYAYGMYVWDLYPMSDGYRPIEVWEQGGSTRSFSSKLVVLPEQDVVIALLSNGMNDDWTDTVDALLRVVVDPLPPVSDYQGPAFDPSVAGSNVGSYEDPLNLGTIEVTGSGDQLRISIPSLEVQGYEVDPELEPRSTDQWTAHINAAPFELTFLEGADGTRYLRNQWFVGARDHLEAPAVIEPVLAQPAFGPPGR